MAGFIPAPPPAPRVGWDGQEALRIPKPGLTILPGVGLRGRTDPTAGRLLLDSAAETVAELWDFHIAGTLAARTLGKWRNRRSSARGTIAAIQLNLDTAAGGTATDHFRITLTDALGRVVVLPLSGTGSYFDFDQFLGAVVANLGAPFGGTYPGSIGSVGPQNCPGGWQEITPTQDLTITGYRTGAWVAGGAFWDHRRLRGSIYTRDWRLLGSGDAYSVGGDQTTAAKLCTFAFDEALILRAGEPYRITLDALDGGDLRPSGTAQTIQVGATGRGSAPAGQPFTHTGSGSLDSASTSQAAYEAFRWEQYDDTPVLSDGLVRTSSGGGWTLELLGAPSGIAPIYGDLTARVDTVGAPLAGAGGAGGNLRVVILP